MKKLFLFTFFLAILITAGVGCNDSTNNDRRIVSSSSTPNEMFKALIADPANENIRYLEGYGETSQGHNSYLTFIAPDKFVKKLIAIHDYKELACNDKSLATLINPPKDYMKKMSFWDADLVVKHAQIKCYHQSGYSNKWTSNGESEFLIDHLENDTETVEPYWKVYFHETGI